MRKIRDCTSVGTASNAAESRATEAFERCAWVELAQALLQALENWHETLRAKTFDAGKNT